MADEESGVRSANYFLNPLQSMGSTVLLLTSPDDNLRRLELCFRNMRENNNGEAIAITDSFGLTIPPLMSERGVISVLSMVQSILSRVTMLSNLDQKEIMALIDYLADTLARDLMINREAYCISDISVRDKIYFGTLTQSYICMKRAFEEGDRRFLKGSQQEITTKVQQEAQGGMFSRMMGWGGKK